MVGVTSLSVAYPCTVDCDDKDAHWFWWYTALIATGGFIALIAAVFALQWCYDYYGTEKCFKYSLSFFYLAMLHTYVYYIVFQLIFLQEKANSGK